MSAPAARRARALRRRRITTVAFVAILVVGLSLGGAVVARRLSAATPGQPAGAAAVHFSVGKVDCTFVDGTRSTHDYATGSSIPSRTLVTDVLYPTTSPTPGRDGAHPAVGHGPYPMIVFAAGYDVYPSQYFPLLDAWVDAGYVVVAPIFPDTNPAAVAAIGGADTGEADDVNQPADVAFVTREALASASGSSATCPTLDGLIAPGAVGLAGQSDGAETVAALAYNSAYRIAGVSYKAVAVMSGSVLSPGTTAAHPGGAALLVVQSNTDRCNVPDDSTTIYNDVAQPDKWFLELYSADHLAPYNDADPSAFNLVKKVTTRFFRDELASGGNTAGLLAYSNEAPTVGHLTDTPSAPTMAQLLPEIAACYLDVH